ncbi:hypothetical protein ILUMI_25064 [Ignelater luminosus]|uniref:Uncharacterized protein n=1 Tax=Ignelater luminosus TaxID=2038154 RepID=A0A8K0G017_IGNLU|nr:hypothetical protein ILUMI_25064 [Ignelater luminosus]
MTQKPVSSHLHQKKTKIVLLLSTKHYRNEIDNRSSGKPKTILEYYRPKASTDTLGILCHTYTTGQETRRWPMRAFMGMLDQRKEPSGNQDIAVEIKYLVAEPDEPEVSEVSMKVEVKSEETLVKLFKTLDEYGTANWRSGEFELRSTLKSQQKKIWFTN